LNQQFDEAEEVEDTEETEHMRKLYELEKQLTPEYIAKKVIPRVEEILSRTDGRFSGYVIWPEYRLGYKEPEDRGFKNKKRNLDNKLKIGDLPIQIAGILIGKVVLTVPFLNPAAWNGLGVPL
jgi:hypothetical protein